VNTVKFCKDFNEYTSELSNYFKLYVSITINENKSFEYTVKLPSVGNFIALLRKSETEVLPNGSVIAKNYISIIDLFKLAKFKHPNIDFKKSIPIMMGTLASANINVKI
jgi:ribosomal protein L11